MAKVVFALADSIQQADRIVQRLIDADFGVDEISVLFSNEEGRVAGHGQGPYARRAGAGQGNITHEKASKAPEGGVAGATAGGIIGGTIGLLAGIGALAIPGLGPFVAAGPIVAALSGSAVGGALGLLVGSLVGLGIPEYEAKKYESSLREGSVLIAVHAIDSESVSTAKEILEQEDAHDISTSTEKAAPRR